MAERLAYLEAIVGADITQFRRGMAEIRNETGLLSERSRGISAMGRRMTYTLAAPLVAVGGLAASVYGEFDENMRNINAIARMSEADLHSLSQETLEWGKNTRSGAVEASNALYTIYSAGVTDADEAMRIMKASTMTAEAGLADLETTTEALTATLLAYGDKSEPATTRASNAITAMVALGVGEMETFANSMSKPLTTAAVLGVKVEDVFNTLAFLTQRGESPAKAATQTYRLLAGMIKPSTAMQSAFAKLGVKNAKDLVTEYGTLQKAILAVVGTTDGSLEKINKLWVNTLGARGITTLTSDIDGWNESIADFNKLLPDATKKAHEEQMKSFTAQVGLFKSALEATAIVIGEKLVPKISDFLGKMTTLLIKITDADPKLVNMGVAFAGIVIAISPLLWILPTLLNPVTLLVTGLGLLAAAFATDFKDIRTTVKTKVEAITGDLTPLVDSLNDLWNILFPKTEGEVSEDKSILDMLDLSPPTSEQMKEVFTPETPVSLWSLFEGSIAQDEGFSWHWFMKAAAKAGWTGGAIPAGQTLVIEYDGLEIDIAGGTDSYINQIDNIRRIEGLDPSNQPPVMPNFGERIKLALSTVGIEIKDHLKKIWDNVLTYLKTEARDDISDWWVELKTNVTATWEDHKPAIKARFDLIRARWNRFFRDGTAPYEHGTETSDISKIWSRLKESVTATWEDHKPAIKARFDLIRARWNRFFRDGTAPYEHGTETSDISKIWSRLKESVTATWEDHKPAIKARFDLIRARWNRFFRDGTAPYEHGTETSDISQIWSRLKESVTATWEDHKPAIKARFDLIRARWNRFFRDGTAPYEHGTETSDISQIWSRLKESVTATWEDHKPAIKARFDLIRARWNRFFRDGTAPYEHGTETSDISQIWSRLKESVTATWEDHKPAIKARFDLIRARWNRFFRDGTAPYEHGTERSGISKIWTRLKNEITETWEEHKPAIKARILKISKDISGFFSGGGGGVGDPDMYQNKRSPFQKSFDSMTTGIDTWYAENSPTILAKITTIASGIKDHLGSETNIATIAEGAAILLTDGFAVFSTLNTWFAEEFPTIHADLTLIAKGIGDWFKDDGADVVAYGIGYFVGSIGVKISQGLIKLKDFFFGGNLIAFLGKVQQGAETFGSGFNQALTDSGVEDFTFADKILTGIVGALVTYSIGATVFAPFGAKIIGAITSSIGFAALGKAVGLTSMSLKVVKMVGSGIFSLSASVYATLLAPAASKILSGVTSAIGAATSLPVTSAGISIGMKISGLVNAAFAGVSAVAGTFSTVASFVMAGIVQDIKTGSLSLAGTRTAIALLVDGAFVGVKAVGSRFKNAGLWARQGISTAILSGQINLMGIKDKISTAISAALGTGLAKGLISGASGALATGAVVATALAPVAIAVGVITLAVGAVKFLSDEGFRDSVHHAILKVLSGRDFKVPMSVSADVKTEADFEEAGYDPEAFDSFTMSKWLVNEIQKDYMKDWVLDLDIPGINYSWQSDIPIDIPDAPQTVKDKILASWKESFGDTNPLTILSDWHDDLITFEAHAVAVSDLLGFDPNDLDAEAVIAIEAITNMADAQALLMDKVISTDMTGEEFVTTYLDPIDLAWVGMYGAEGTMTAAYSGFVTGLVTDTTTLSTTMDTFNTDASADVLAFKASAVPDFKKVGTAVSGVKTEVDELSTSLSNLDGIEVSFKVIVNKIEVEPEGSFAKGLGYVPHDNYRANLHKGEMILPRDDAESYRRGQGAGVTNIYNTIEVHAESADDILRELDRRGIYVN